jgi:Anti-sigma-K factor rskA
MSQHEEFLELCAASTACELTKEERRKLDEHLLGCASCREALKQLQETVRKAVPAIAAELPQINPQPDNSWSQDKAEAALFERLSKEDRRAASGQTPINIIDSSERSNRRAYFPSRFDWGQMWMSYAAVILLFLALVISAYRVGIRRGAEVAVNVSATAEKGSNSLEEQLSDISHDRETLRLQLASRDKAIDDLRQQVERMKAQESERVEHSASGQKEKENRLAEEAASVSARLADLQKILNAEEKTRSEESLRASALDAKLGELTKQLYDREETIAGQTRILDGREGTIDQQQAKLAKQQELLDHDRDVRELMGARHLYIADVFDIEPTGQTKKPFGRVFYTKGKSLVFYAYDLDQQETQKNGNAFQAWAQRGGDKQQSMSLGIFFEDNTSKKRWVMRSDDPATLAQIDAVFVTVEPNGGSQKPSGKQLLFAYLKSNPSHP